MCSVAIFYETCCYENNSTTSLNTYALPGDVIGATILLPFSLIKSAYCARSSVLCNILHACNLSTSENFHICHAVMCYFLIFLICFRKHTRVFRGSCLESHWSKMHINSFFETLNISINISPPDLTAAFISYV